MEKQHAAGPGRTGALRALPRRFWAEPANRKLVAMAAAFLVVYLTPFGAERVTAGVLEAFGLLSYYAREHVLYSLVPAFFIAGAISAFLNQQAVIKYLGPEANPGTAYGVASVSGCVLSVCSCTVLPLFKGIYKKGAGIGPAVAFLYSGPAVNVLAIILTARVLGVELGIARAVGAVVFAVVIGVVMHLIYRREDAERRTNAAMFSSAAGADPQGAHRRPVWKAGLFMLSLLGILLFLNWAPSDGQIPLWDLLYAGRHALVGLFAVILAYSLVRWLTRTEIRSWLVATRDFAVQILPLLLVGIFVAGFLLGRPGEQALIPEGWIAQLVGANSVPSTAFAAIAGAFMYFATLTEVPILQGLIGAGMAEGPALALLLGGPSMSLPSLMVIYSELGLRKTAVYMALVVTMSTISGLAYAAAVT